MFTAVLMVAMVGGGEVANSGCDDGCIDCYGGYGIGAGVGGYDAGIGIGGGYGAGIGIGDGCDSGIGLGDGHDAGIGIGGGYGAGIGIGDGYDAGIGIGGVVPPPTTVPATTTPAQTQQRSEAEAPATIIDNVPADARVTAGVNTTQSRYYYNPGDANERSARITVHLPENAKLYVDDRLSQKKSSTRRFLTPPLPVGEDFHYTLLAEMERDGKTIRTSKEITVRGGKSVEVTLAFPED
jgi:uncharacterized protein (TIGR03000 family)